MNQENPTENLTTETSSAKKQHSRKRLLTAVSVALLLVTAVGGLLFGPALFASEPAAAAPTRPPMPVETAEVRVADSTRVLSAVGSLAADESVLIVAELPGRIEKIGFREVGSSKQGKLLIKLESAVLQAELDRASAGRQLSHANYQRAESLLKDHAVSTKERDEAYAQWQLDEATVRLTEAQLAKTSIHAPFAGTLGLRQVSLGEYVLPGQPLVNLQAIEQLKVEFKLPQKSYAEVKVGQRLTVTTDTYPEREFVGQVYAIDPQVEVQSRSLVVRGRLDNSDRALLPGQFVEVKLQVATKHAALFIPEQALIPQPKTQLVYKVVDGKAQMVAVTTGSRSKGWVEITSGLVAGDLVVTGGHQKIGPGSPVKSLPADPNLFAKID